MEILNFEEQPTGSYAIALFDVYLGPNWGIVYRKFKLCRSKQGHLYFQTPSYKKGESNGKAEWGSYIDFTIPEKGKDFSKSVMDALKPFTEKLNSSESPSF